MKNKTSRIILVVLLLLPALCFASCAKANESLGNSYDADAKYPTAESPEIGMGNDKLNSTAPPADIVERKIIKTYDLNAETKEFDTTISAIAALVAEHGGYVESNSVSNRNYGAQSSRYASYKFRIPAENAEEFVSSVGNTLNVTRNNSYVEDVSESYYSIEATLQELQTERDSLLAIMESINTQQDYDFWLTVQTRLSTVRQQIARYQAQLNNYDSRVAYSTINLSINEVVTYTPTEEGFFAKISNAFVEGWVTFGEFMEGLVVVIITIFPFLIIPGIALAVIIVLVRRNGKKKREQKAQADRNEKAE